MGDIDSLDFNTKNQASNHNVKLNKSYFNKALIL